MYLLFLWLFGAQMALASLVPFQGPKKSRFSGSTPSNAPRNDVAPLKTIKYKRHKKTGTWVVLCTWMLLLCVVVCNGGGEVSLHLCCVRRYSGGGGWLAGLLLPK